MQERHDIPGEVFYGRRKTIEVVWNWVSPFGSEFLFRRLAGVRKSIVAIDDCSVTNLSVLYLNAYLQDLERTLLRFRAYLRGVWNINKNCMGFALVVSTALTGKCSFLRDILSLPSRARLDSALRGRFPSTWSNVLVLKLPDESGTCKAVGASRTNIVSRVCSLMFVRATPHFNN